MGSSVSLHEFETVMSYVLDQLLPFCIVQETKGFRRAFVVASVCSNGVGAGTEL